MMPAQPPAHDLDRNPKGGSGHGFGQGATLQDGDGVSASTLPQPSSAACAPPTPSLCSQGPCDVLVTQGGSWGFQSSH